MTSSKRDQILNLVQQYCRSEHQGNPFIPGQSVIPVSGRVYDETDMTLLVESALDFWLTTGRFNDAFEAGLAKELGVPHVLTTNSGSSSLLIAIAALCSHELKDKALQPGDEVITVAAGFPATVNPLLLYQLVPVFVDVTLPDYNIDVCQLEQALSPKTKAIVLAHTLGNPFNVDAVMAFAKAHGLYVIEDCCDALGSTYNGQKVGTFGDIGTLSFYPAHHITTGEGGAVFTKRPLLKKIMTSLREWGRDCWCAPGVSNTCQKRFEWTLGQLPYGYDHKYIYSHLGYNLKLTDMQAAVGVAQLAHLPDFTEKRRQHFQYLSNALTDLQDHLILPKATPNSVPSWFGFPITLQKNNPFERQQLLQYLFDHKIETRLLFAGNITKQPYMSRYTYRTINDLPVTNHIMTHTFWIGVYPGLSTEMMDYVVSKLRDWIKAPKSHE